MQLNQRNILSPYRLTFLGRVRLRSLTLWAILPKKFPRQSNLRRIQAKPQSSLQTSQSNIHLKGPQTLPRPRTHHSMITSLFARFLSGKNGTRQEIIQTNKSSTSRIKFQGKLARYDCRCSSSTGEHSFTESCSLRSSFRIGN